MAASDTDTGSERTIVVALQILVYVLAFALPTAVLALIFRHYAATIINISMYVFFAVSTLLIGAGWSHPSFTPGLRLYTLLILIGVVAAAPTISLINNSNIDFWYFGRIILLRAALVFGPFLIGCAIGWRNRKQLKTL